MNLEMVMQELEALGKERTKKIYISNGAHEPLLRRYETNCKENKNKSTFS